jgi:hypothetical protein
VSRCAIQHTLGGQLKPRVVRSRHAAPTARHWYGRLLVDDPHPSEQARGRAMVAAAATDFRSLEMVTYANPAEQFLRR